MISQRIAEAYDRIANDFARINAAMPDTLADCGHRFLSLIGPDARVLDVGCGAGRDKAWMEAQGTHVTGVDLSVGMLAQAHRRVRGELLQGDMRRLPFPNGAFAGVWCMAALLHLSKADAPAALAEMRCVLAPCGVLRLSLQEGEGETWEQVPYRGEAVERFFARYAHDEARALLQHAGFAILESSTGEAGDRRWLQFLARAAPGGVGDGRGGA
jgi:ubiquinone/menaquinone biosynthesis C-methylase UbiE